MFYSYFPEDPLTKIPKSDKIVFLGELAAPEKISPIPCNRSAKYPSKL
jgi:hypothetical protein